MQVLGSTCVTVGYKRDITFCEILCFLISFIVLIYKRHKKQQQDLNTNHFPYLFNIFDTLANIVPLDLIFNCVRVVKNGKVFLQGQLHKMGGQGRQVRQVPQQLQNLHQDIFTAEVRQQEINQQTNHQHLNQFQAKLGFGIHFCLCHI